MADVFVSYKAEDRKWVARLVEALEADGLTAWWDAHIGGGDDWRDTIQHQLDQAKCVIVVWSKRSVGPGGHFVRDEASRAQRLHTYLPLRIDKVDPPLGFGETQALSLTGWRGARSDPRYKALLDTARAVISGGPRPHYQHDDERGVSRRTLVAGAAVAAVAAVAAGAGGWLLLRSGSRKAGNSIAVLPFANLSGDPDQAYFSDGLAEELRIALSRIPELKVVARTSSEKVRNDDVETAARKLGVGNVLTGSVRRSPSMIRIGAQLIDGKSGLERWSEAYDRPLGNVLAIQADIARKVAEALSIELGRAEREAMTAGGTSNPAAQDLFLRANAVWLANPDREGIENAIGLFDQAIALDPTFAEAFAKKGRAIRDVTTQFSDSAADYGPGLAKADAAAREALKLAPGLKSAYVTLASTRVARLDFKGAIPLFERAGAATSNDMDAQLSYAWFVGNIGRTAEAIELTDRAIAIDPINPAPHAMRIWLLILARRYSDAVASARHLLEWSPDLSFARCNMAAALMMLGKLDEVRPALAEVPVEFDYRAYVEALLAARVGDRAESDRLLAEMRRSSGDAFSYQYAVVHAQRGEKDLAFKELDRSVELRDPGLIFLPTDPFLDPLRPDPRFAALIRKLDFP